MARTASAASFSAASSLSVSGVSTTRLHAAGAQRGLDAQVDTGDAVLAVDPGARRDHRTGVLGDRARHPGRRRRRGVVRRPGLEQPDDLGAAVAGPLDQLLDLRGVEHVGQRLAVDGAARRHRHHRLAVRTQRQRLHRRHRNLERLGDEVGEPGRVEHAGLPDHPVLREAGGQLRQRGHLVERVGHDDDHGARRVLGDVLRHLPHDLGVDLEQVHPAHAGLARQAGGDHDDVRALDGLVALAARPGGLPDDPRLEALDRPRLAHVQRQALGLALDDVGQYDRLEDVVLGQALRGRRPVETGAYDGDLLAHEHPPMTVPRPYPRRSAPSPPAGHAYPRWTATRSPARRPGTRGRRGAAHRRRADRAGHLAAGRGAREAGRGRPRDDLPARAGTVGAVRGHHAACVRPAGSPRWPARVRWSRPSPRPRARPARRRCDGLAPGGPLAAVGAAASAVGWLVAALTPPPRERSRGDR